LSALRPVITISKETWKVSLTCPLPKEVSLFKETGDVINLQLNGVAETLDVLDACVDEEVFVGLDVVAAEVELAEVVLVDELAEVVLVDELAEVVLVDEETVVEDVANVGSVILIDIL
jgi:hypothetical protein